MDSPARQPLRVLLKLTLAVCLVEVLALFVRSALQVSLTDGGMAENVARDLSYLVVPPLLLLLLLPLGRGAFAELRGRLRLRQLSPRIVLLGVALGLTVRLASWGVLLGGVAFGVIRNPDPAAIAGPSFDWHCPPAAIAALHLLVMAVLVPLVEESIHRGWFLHWYARYGRTAAVLFSSLLFALAHKPSSMAAAFAFGALLGVLALNSGSLWGPLAAHATANALILLDWLCLRATWNPRDVTDALRGVGALAFALAICAYALALLLVSKRVIGQRPDDPRASH